MILTGRSERAAKALRLGLVDELVPRSILLRTAMAAADRLARGGGQRRASQGGLPGFFLDRTPAGRRLVYRQARAQVLKKTGGHYPAPLAALEAVQVGLEHGVAAGLAEEHRAFGHLAVGDVSRKLVQIFFATTALKKDDGVPPGSGSLGRSAGSAWWARASWGRESPAPRCSTSRWTPGSRTPTSSGWGRGSGPPADILDERFKRRRLTRPQHERLRALLSGSDDYRRLRPRRPGDRGGVRGARAQAPDPGRSGAAGAARCHLRQQYLHHSDPRDRGRGGAPRASAGDALLLSRREDAAARGDPDRGHEPRGDRDRGPVRPPDGQDGDRGRGSSRLLGQPDPLALPGPGGAPGRGRGAHRADRSRHDGVGIPGRARWRCSTRSGSTWRRRRPR